MVTAALTCVPFATKSRSEMPNASTSWSFVRGGFKTVLDLSAIGPNDIWGAGTPGIFHFDGNAWRLVIETPQVIAIEMASDGTGWASSSGGLLHYDGTAWNSVPDHEAIHFLDIDLVGLSDGWSLAPGVVDGNIGTWIYRLSQGRWIRTRFWIAGNYSALAVVNSSNIWLVGSSGMAHFDGDTLLQVQTGSDVELSDVAFANASSGWAVGGECSQYMDQRRVILRYDGQSWTTLLDQPRSGFLQRVGVLSSSTAIAGDNAGHAVIISDTAISEYESRYIASGERCYDDGIQGLAVLPEDDTAILAGTSGGPFGNAYVAKYHDATLTPLHGQKIMRLAMASNRLGWALGDRQLLQYNGETWSTMTEDPAMPNTESLFDIATTADGRLIVAGKNGIIAELNGTRWQQFKTSEAGAIHRIARSFDGTMWALGRRTVSDQPETFVLRMKATGGIWEPVIEVRGSLGEDIAATDSTSVWVVGQDGFILHGDHGQWSHWNLPDSPLIASVSTGRDDSAWAVTGDNILKLHRDTWDIDNRVEPRLKSELTDLELTQVHAVGDDDAWTVGRDSNILHFHNSMWQYDRAFGQGDGWVEYNSWQLNDVEIVDDTTRKRTVWIVGDSETIMRREYEGQVSPWPTLIVPTSTVNPSREPVLILHLPIVVH